ncbi:MAG TPA: DUF4367 domain-containing protein [Sedimentibacter sp.]|jgi:hypothetical protein|nr:DUF4367 domain-containing protein [Sedimentibacter sp.]
MKNNNNDNFNEDFLIKKAALSLVEKDNELLDLLEKDTSIVNSGQDELDKEIYSMIYEEFGKKNTKQIKIKKQLLKASILALVMISGFIIPFTTVDAFREKVLNLYIEIFDTHASFKPKEDDIFREFKVNYIPEGYTKIDEIKTPSFYFLIYNNKENNMIDITLYANESSFNVDSEECEKYNVHINNKDGYIYRKDTTNITIFEFHGNTIIINSNDNALSNETLIKIAESIK